MCSWNKVLLLLFYCYYSSILYIYRHLFECVCLRVNADLLIRLNSFCLVMEVSLRRPLCFHSIYSSLVQANCSCHQWSAIGIIISCIFHLLLLLNPFNVCVCASWYSSSLSLSLSILVQFSNNNNNNSSTQMHFK